MGLKRNQTQKPEEQKNLKKIQIQFFSGILSSKRWTVFRYSEGLSNIAVVLQQELSNN
jgi:hypothetical protein